MYIRDVTLMFTTYWTGLCLLPVVCIEHEHAFHITVSFVVPSVKSNLIKVMAQHCLKIPKNLWFYVDQSIIPGKINYTSFCVDKCPKTGQ